jgi:succinate dehydrogenase/fumarate reductase flavoprotein subunit
MHRANAHDDELDLGEKCPNEKGLSRRSFLAGAGLLSSAAAVGATIGLSGCSPSSTPAPSDVATGNTDVNPYPDVPSADQPVTTSSLGERAFVELQYLPEVSPPAKTEYESDVVVVGCGWAGLHAAVTAAKTGASVLVVDKGRPGYSGLSPFSQGATYFLPEFDDREGVYLANAAAGEFVANQEWFDLWLDESAQVVEENKEFGFMDTYPTATETGYWDKWDPRGYRQSLGSTVRQEKWLGVLEQYNIEVVEHTMLVDVTRSDGAITGAVGLHVKSNTPVTFKAKAVVLCTGTGSMKSTGYPTSGDTFDGEYICVNLGLTMVGKEFDDFHQTSSFAPGNYFYNNCWEYSENMSGTNVNVSVDTVNDYATSRCLMLIKQRISSVLAGLVPQDGTAWNGGRAHNTSGLADDDPRNTGFDRSKERVRDVFGAAPGMNSQMSCGVFCGWDDKDGFTGIPGLYVAGNGIYGCMVDGAKFGVQTNHPGCCVMGNHAGTAAAAYAATASVSSQDQAQVAAITDEIFAPSKLAKGLDPNFIAEQLRDIMVDPGVHIVKSEKALTAALMKVELIRDKYLPMVMGYTGHELRLCLEVKHKVLSAEMKLKANLYRTESRGMHYREDYPYHDDANWLCHVGVSQDGSGTVSCRKIEIPDSWKGDLSLSHEERYPVLFPGEAAALSLAEDKWWV